jgi:hypothetical protein
MLIPIPSGGRQWNHDDHLAAGLSLFEVAFNRRMPKTARTVVWEGAGAQSPTPDPILLKRLRRKGRTVVVESTTHLSPWCIFKKQGVWGQALNHPRPTR